MQDVATWNWILDESLAEWQSDEFLDAALKRLCKRDDAKVKDAHALVKTIEREQNDKQSKKIGLFGDFDTRFALMTAMFERASKAEPLLILKIHDIQTAIAKFNVMLVDALKRHNQAQWDALYPNISLGEYHAGPDFWHINAKFPGLQAVHKDPWIFICKNALTPKMCKQLIAKAEPFLVPSWVNRGDRTSWEVRIRSQEVVGAQERLSKLLQMPVTHFESLKVSRYVRGEYFAPHLDAVPNSGEEGFPTCGASQPFSNRVVTCFVYLNDVRHGGSTKFDCGIKIRPVQGMAVVHFPAYMDTAARPEDRGRIDERTVHASREAQDDKYICQQWGWTGPLDRALETRCNGARTCTDGVV